MVALLVTHDELRTWTREPIDAEEDVVFADSIIDAVSLRISEELGHPEFLEDSSDVNTRSARAVALQVARRTYLNPDQETRTAAIGPIGGVSYLEDFAQALTLTESELERLARIRRDDSGGTGGLGLVRIERDDPLLHTEDIVLQDSAQPESSGIIYAHQDDAMWFTPEDEA